MAKDNTKAAGIICKQLPEIQNCLDIIQEAVKKNKLIQLNYSAIIPKPPPLQSHKDPPHTGGAEPLPEHEPCQ
jgi:hypothetical protein